MKLIHLLTAMAGACILYSCTSKMQEANYQVVPLPASITPQQGQSFDLTGSTVIAYPQGNDDLERYAQFLGQYIQQLTGKQMQLVTEPTDKNAIVLASDLQNDNPEAYNLTVNGSQILINGATPAGTFYGIQTLRKSIPMAAEGNVSFPAVNIEDAPRFAYRGAHLDVSRHFLPIDSVKSFIDMMALHNINTFHWHLTDDQGWRLEIKSRPELTEKASVRPQTVIGHNTGEYDGTPHGGYYTQDQVRDLIQYAADRNITVIPEIDLPGHMLGALTAYPELGCKGGPYELWQIWGVSEDVLCAGNPKTYDFIDDVLGEVVDLFPSEYIHVGGDECPKESWIECVRCQALIKQLGLKTDSKHTKEEKLQSHVIHHASDFLTSKGRKMIGWDETLEGGLAPGAIVMSWRGENGGMEAAKAGHDAIMTPNTYLYFDYYQSLDYDNEPEAIGGYLPIEKVYSYEPVPEGLTPEEAAHIIGVQANLWTEYIPTYSQVEYMELPRMAALSEIQWRPRGTRDAVEFIHRLPQLVNHYEANGYNYASHIFNVDGKLETDPENNGIRVTLSTADNAPIRYTLDGTEPTAESTLYEGPVLLNKTSTIKADAFRDHGRKSRVYTSNVSFNKATTRPIALANEPQPRFAGNGPQTLVDGQFGPNNYSNNAWLGFYNNDMDAVIDLGSPMEISDVTIHTMVNTGDWVMDARGLEVYVSKDGENYTQVFNEKYPAMEKNYNQIFTHNATFAPVEVQYVKVVANVEKTLPKWHSGAGRPGYLFVDEIEVN